MATARDLLTQFFHALSNLDTSVDRCVDLFANDGVFELPYLATLGMPSRFEGKVAVRQVLELIRSHYPSFTLSDIVVHDLRDGHGLFVEYHSESPIRGTDRLYKQDYVTCLIEGDGEIKLLREYMNIISAARELLPNGLADLPPKAP